MEKNQKPSGLQKMRARVKYQECNLLTAVPDMMGRDRKHRTPYQDISTMGIEQDSLDEGNF